jgi:cytochrome c553
MPKHIARLILLMVAFGVAALVGKSFFTTDSFYRYGHYRGDSVAEIASDKPKFKGSDYCQPCHAARFAEWSAGVHHSVDVGKAVQCEVCHGAAGARDIKGKFEHVSTGLDHPASGKLAVPPDTLKLCPICHERMPGRPAEQKQIDVATHAGTQQCTTCHNPHSPKLIRIPGAPADHPANGPAGKLAVCAGCHGSDGVSVNPVWPNLAGQHDAYLIEALKAYRSNARENAMMAPIAKTLTDADLREIATHFSGLTLKTASAAVADKDSAVGKAKAVACAGCHGADGVSSNPAWPTLAGQQRGYLIAALRAYRDGMRKNEVMAGMTKGLSDSDVDALAGYFSNVRPTEARVNRRDIKLRSASP